MKKVVIALQELFALYDAPVSNEKLALFVRSLQHLDEAFLLAVINDVKYEYRSDFPPKFSNIIDYAYKRLAAEYLSAEDAWGQVAKYSSKYGGWDQLTPQIQAAIDNVCGWKAIRTTDNLLYYRSAFISAYKEIIEAETRCKLKP